MVEVNGKGRLASYAGEVVAALLVVQPLLDVMSYFLGAGSWGILTTSLRLFQFVAFCLYGFLLSDKKQFYAALYGLIGGFWLLHALNCFRVGYVQPVMDLEAYCKIVQFPLWTASFLTCFRKREELDLRVTGALTVAFALILMVIGLSYAVGSPVYTYEYPERGVQIGVMGWFSVHSAQSAIVCLLVPGVLLWGYRTQKLWVFCLCVASGLGLLYFTGTRLAYYTALLIAVVFLAVILLSRRQTLFCLPLLAALVLLLACRGVSPMEQRQQVSANSFSLYQKKIDQVMGEDKDFVYQEGEEIPPEILEKITTVYRDLYGAEGEFGETLLQDLNARFGVERVMETYRYSIRSEVLNNARIRKMNYMGMLWEDQDFLTHLLGMEMLDGNSYDPENDFPALLFYYGYLGIGLYLAFLVYLVGYAAFQFIRRFPTLLVPEFAAPAMMAAIAVGAAQFSGSTLRWPNVTVYFSLAAAMVYHQADTAPLAEKLRPGHKRNPAVSLKKIG